MSRPADWYGSPAFERVHQEIAEKRAERERLRLAARTPEQLSRDAHEVAWEIHETCAKSGERRCDPTKDGHVCSPSGPRPGPAHGQRAPLWRDPKINNTTTKVN